MTEDTKKDVITENENEPEQTDIPVSDELTSALSDEIEKAFLDSEVSSKDKDEASVIDYNGAAVLEDEAQDQMLDESPAEISAPADNPPSGDVETDFSEPAEQPLEEKPTETSAPAHMDSHDISNEDDETIFENDKAKLDKDDIAEELQKSLDETIFSSESANDEILNELGLLDDKSSESTIVDNADLDKEGIQEDIFTEKKVSLDREGIPEDIFPEDKAVLDKEGIPEGAITADKAQLDIEGIPQTEKKKEESPVPEIEHKQEDTEVKSKLDIFKNIITRLKETPLVKITIISLSLLAALILCTVIVVLVLFPDADKNNQEEIFTESAPAVEEKIDPGVPLIENLEMKTFVIPMIDPAKGTCFLKTDLILTFNNVNIDELKNNTIKMREAVYNQFLNKNPEIILKKLKRSEHIYKLKNSFNLIFKKDAVKEISIVNFKIV